MRIAAQQDEGLAELAGRAYGISMRLLGLDVGDKRIGIAVTDPLGWTVQPVATIERSRLEQDLETIACYVQDYAARRIVIGLPLRGVEGEVGIQAKKVQRFREQLRAYCVGRGLTVDCVEWDESMTTHEAEEFLRRAGVPRSRRKAAIDQMAAVMILQSYLAAQGEHPSI